MIRKLDQFVHRNIQMGRVYRILGLAGFGIGRVDTDLDRLQNIYNNNILGTIKA